MVGIIIPTKNRSRYMIRALRYYASVNCKHAIYIGDSSDREHATQIVSFARKLKGQLNVVYKYYPGLGAAWAAREVANCVSEPYAVFSGDDDLLIPDSLTLCETFLSKNPDFASAHGNGILLSVVEKSHTLKVLTSMEYRLGDNEFENAADRIKKFLNNYWVVQFSVQRTPGIQAAFSNIDRFADPSFTEILCNCVSIANGKSKKFDFLHLIRQVHSQRGILKRGVEWVIAPEFQSSLEVFRQTLSQHLSEKDGIDEKEALDLVNSCFLNLLDQSFRRLYATQSGREKLLNTLMRLPRPMKLFLRSIYNNIKSLWPGEYVAFDLPSLLKTNSAFHKDFLLVYQSLTENLSTRAE